MRAPAATADEIPVRGIAHAPYRERLPAVAPVAGPVNPDFPGITTFRGNLTRSYYGEGPVPRRPRVLWRYPRSGGMCADSTDETGTYPGRGVGWTGQPNVIPHDGGRVELRFGAYDTNYHFLDARTGEQIHDSLDTGDLAKGSATSDPDGYPLYYAGSRDNNFRVVALDRGRVPEVLWSLNASFRSAPEQVWNDDWDAAALVVGDYLLAGGENSWLHVIKLNRGWTSGGKVRVRPRVVLTLPSWDDPAVGRRAGAPLLSREFAGLQRRGGVIPPASAELGKLAAEGSGTVGVPRQTLLKRILPRADARWAEAVEAALASRGALVIVGDEARAPGRSDLAGADRELSERIADFFRSRGLDPPSPSETVEAVRHRPKVVEGLIGYLVKTGALVRLPGGWIIAREAVDAVVERVRARGKKPLDVAEFKEMFGLTRRLAIPLLEYLDGAKVTRRIGDRREIV